ncbi:MAG: PHP domain-containing protein, partial [Verrucomicrobia bacterium]|nr:PHP domain-containing protein [Verrucomicrobiota bacterium]
MSAVVHLDADAFFAAVEQAADPRLRGKPVAVGGERRGIVASASYEARRFGIYTPMPTARARKLCPHLLVLPGDFDKYERFSRWMFSYAYDFTPNVEICSIDEGYFDLTGVRRPPIEVAATIRDAIRQALKISVSEGIGTSKLVSQIASKLHKPAAFRSVPAGDEVPFLHPLPNQWLPGIGPKTAQRLNAAGLALIRQVAQTPVDLLSLLVGRAAPQLRQFANGIDERPVVPAHEPAKSYSQQETFQQDQTDEDFLRATLRRMADRLFAKARTDGKSVRTLTVKVRYNDMAEDQVSESLAEPTDLETDVYTRLDALLRCAWRRRVSLRLVSLKLANLYDGVFRLELALDRAAQQHDARRRLADIVDQLRAAHGQNAILRGHDFRLRTGEPNPTLLLPAAGETPSGTVSLEPIALRLRLKKKPERPGGSVPSDRLGGAEDNAPGRRGTVALRPPRSAFPLVVRSHYSFLNSTLAIPAIIELAQRHDLAVATLCDQGNLHGAVEFMLAARAAGLKPVLGAEIRLEGQPLWLFVQNQVGYANLCRLLSRPPKAGPSPPSNAAATLPDASFGSANRSRLSTLALRDFTEGLMAVSADTALAALFPGRFYRAIATRAELRRYNPRTGGPPAVPVAPVHYATPADRWKFDVVQSIRTLTLLHQAHPDKLMRGQFHFRASAEWDALFGGHPELGAHLWELADRCEFAFALGRPQFPAFQPPDGSTPRAFLRALVLRGLRARYPAAQIPKLEAQVDEELRIIAAVGYEEYFLVVWDLLQACRARGIDWITRGSAADSLVCYSLGISGVCPIRFE